MKSSRLANIIVSVIAIILLTFLVMLFINRNQAEYLPEDQPNNIVNNYILSLVKSDYKKAYSYLANVTDKPGFTKFQNGISHNKSVINNANVTIGEVIQEGQTATVQLNIRQNYERNLLTNPDLYNKYAQLLLENGSWKITSMPEPYWSEEWNKD
jgi:predicted PurR-regulated permease PerM